MPIIDLPDSTKPVLTCAQWLTESDFSLCTRNDFDPPEMFASIVAAGTDLLYVATARQFGGVCADTVYPVATLALDAEYSFGLSALPRWSDGSVWLGGLCSCGVTAVGLPGFPVVDVTGVTIDGVAEPAGSWRIVDDRYVVRANGATWPCGQHLGTTGWTVAYTWGQAPPAAGLLALQTLVCELGKAWRGDKTCRLPKRLQSITRENLTQVIIDPMNFLDGGRFGVYEIDVFVARFNPDGLTESPRVFSPRLPRAHHVR